ncbi:RNA 2',3'-cyclic phosphodiesterase [Nocardioides sp. R-C-SC26]|uniref:RNA 2',3'-cyclic phosphodiesterase n=1 Tax=Nocardioides sp. R-C-SC26 TaxID=2870414 RepID=UPI001E4241A0|nr:RNA 2',3'-cyclic phosphodiesterase [Nocardioides sp. R-C-SC26]
MRIFVGIAPPAAVIEHLDAFLEPRREHGPFRWSLAEQFHLTLAFADDAPDWTYDRLVEGLGRAADRRARFEMQVAGGGCFPDVAAAKLLFAGIRQGDAAREELDRLAAGARTAVAHAGIAVDGARFRPHLTLARTNKPVEMTSWVRVLDTYESPVWEVAEIALVQSHLGEGPQRRPRYAVLETFPLGAPRPCGER